MGLMVYAPHGRTGVYMAQDALALLAPTAERLAARVETARRLVRALPETHWLTRNPGIGDHLAGGDAGLVDLLLHGRDRPYTVAAFRALLATSGLAPTAFIEPLRYDPGTYLSAQRLRERAAALPRAASEALAESLSGTMAVHIAYAVRERDGWAAPDPGDETRVPVLRDLDGQALAASIVPGQRIAVNLDGFRAQLPLPPLAPALLARIDGRRRLGEILDAVGAQARAERARRDWAGLYAALNGANKLLLAAPPGG